MAVRTGQEDADPGLLRRHGRANPSDRRLGRLDRVGSRTERARDRLKDLDLRQPGIPRPRFRLRDLPDFVVSVPLCGVIRLQCASFIWVPFPFPLAQWYRPFLSPA